MHPTDPPPDTGLLSVQRTFVVQLVSGADDGRLQGRVEHVVTGRATTFRSLDTLAEFLRGFAPAPRRDEDPEDE